MIIQMDKNKYLNIVYKTILYAIGGILIFLIKFQNNVIFHTFIESSYIIIGLSITIISINTYKFNPNDKFKKAHIETKEMQYLYSDGDLYYFMDNETYDQVPLTKEHVEEAIQYIRENDMATVKFFNGSAFQVDPPNFVELAVIETEPGIKGATATNVTKPATVETGAIVHVPVFINEGDKIKIDTRSGEYLSRA